MIDAGQLRKYEQEGWLKLPGLLDPSAELAALHTAYGELIDALTRCYHAEVGAAAPELASLSLGERFALMLAASGGRAMEHLDPSLTALKRSQRRRGHLPSAQLPELFALMRSAPLLDALEAIVGPEIEAAPSYHVNFKLPPSLRLLSEERASQLHSLAPSLGGLYSFHIDRTPWHRDVSYYLADAWDSEIVAAWIPMTPSGGERGGLTVVPGSHREPCHEQPKKEVLEARSIEISTQPGDVILFHSRLFHASTPNYSEGDHRWSFNFRYLPRGRPGGRPWLPTVLVRSRSEPERELHDGHLWQACWKSALAHLERPSLPLPWSSSTASAHRITRIWREHLPDAEAWRQLSPSRNPMASLRRILYRFTHVIHGHPKPHS